MKEEVPKPGLETHHGVTPEVIANNQTLLTDDYVSKKGPGIVENAKNVLEGAKWKIRALEHKQTIIKLEKKIGELEKLLAESRRSKSGQKAA